MRTGGAVGRAIRSAVAVICYLDSNVKPLDALHLAAALEARCDLFLTNDRRLRSFPGLAVEVLT